MSDHRLVYSTAGGRVDYCPRCERRKEMCVCGNRRMAAPNDGVVRLQRDRRNRGGKTVTVITGIPGDTAALTALATELKRLCGSGGGVRDGAIEIQGDHRERLAARLTELGYRVKLAGG
ncbi:MAG: stress response translation initiation inhibitor YciH [Chloroflexi bacterium]|nr:stress response translation initiation inhibitor YciH [Chloroflexota bacterium]